MTIILSVLNIRDKLFCAPNVVFLVFFYLAVIKNTRKIFFNCLHLFLATGSPFIQEIAELEKPTAHGDGLYRGVPGKPAIFTVDPRGFPGQVSVAVSGRFCGKQKKQKKNKDNKKRIETKQNKTKIRNDRNKLQALTLKKIVDQCLISVDFCPRSFQTSEQPVGAST